VAPEPGSARDGILATRKDRRKTGTGARELIRLAAPVHINELNREQLCFCGRQHGR